MSDDDSTSTSGSPHDPADAAHRPAVPARQDRTNVVAFPPPSSRHHRLPGDGTASADREGRGLTAEDVGEPGPDLAGLDGDAVFEDGALDSPVQFPPIPLATGTSFTAADGVLRTLAGVTVVLTADDGSRHEIDLERFQHTWWAPGHAPTRGGR